MTSAGNTQIRRGLPVRLASRSTGREIAIRGGQEVDDALGKIDGVKKLTEMPTDESAHAFEVEKRPFYVTEDGKGKAVKALFRRELADA